ncbi:MAG: CcoQ/FixQ family Cbb3-type cytochrome c oxidase assembly chaperone [Gammaproteobacteria bacterium]|nr:CcoQ/FixQ family Cbb3-type cytochrome c oxidase assembly chaperone [Gammaproteobacteria bacterium]NIR83519.1 CcoQ/FixQ family Cbb3-type cytochrome c oxidase assembly chaperone [Gammaproteobacteria bacterium]NIR91441.1 CcoQ/FixQ family Cbb3-type cytochrome c oxidase assembly chaperone [Gammaproteobacteria bacterium]NIU04681.1 CcoQ/FixQ family Cbb3-type cytochrome c oxidase assembly chaperone [Gammaproteobacteria bacterium]NIV51723.1 CcoQ/FixQ family Cbb3-type cytochrome c oxidase assembly cha
MEVTTFASVWTIVVLAVFIAIVVWVVSRRKGYFDKAARLPFEDEGGEESESKKEKDHG